jgi:hypothetical protein
MKKRTAVVAALLALAATPSAAQESAKIGFVATFSGPAAVIGNDMRDGFELALDHLGRKVGGLAAQVIYEDDQQKPEVGKQKTDKLIGSASAFSPATSGRMSCWPRSSPRSMRKPSCPRPASRRRYRSTPPSSSTACRCRGSASSRSEFPAPSTG